MAKQVRERGMNAALTSGEAGVGEIKPARTPLNIGQLTVAGLVAVLGAGLAVVTYHAVASRTVSFSGEVTPSATYNLNFPSTGAITTLAVRPGQHVTKGQVLATQDDSVSSANVAAAEAAVTADTAIVAADENPQAAESTLATDQLDVSKAEAAVTSAQGAINLARQNEQNLTGSQNAVITGDQTTLTHDTAAYTEYCAGTSGASAAPTTSTPLDATAAATNVKPTGNPTPSGDPTAGVGSVQYCQNLQTQIDKDSTALAQAKNDLTSLESSYASQSEQDSNNLSESQAVLAAAQALTASANLPMTSATIAQAQSQLAAAKAQLAADQLALRQTSIIAPADGMVAETAGAVGDIAGSDGVHNYTGPAGQAGTLANQQSGIQLFSTGGASAGGSTQTSLYSSLITLYSGGLDVTAQLPETEMAGVRVGRATSVGIAAADVTVPGRVSQIIMVPTTVSNSTYYDVTITMDPHTATVLAGMSVTVTLS